MAELFTTNPEKLSDLLSDVDKGNIQLPDFQRGWVWDEERIQKLLTFRVDRLDEMRTKNSAAYKGVSALLLKNGACDLIKGYTIDNITKFNSANIDIHHIFPQDYCIKIGIAPERYNSIINKAPIAYSTNRSIGGQAPSVYIPKYMDAENGVEKSNELLATQLINPLAIRQDDFDAYYQERKRKLTALIENAIGKKTVDFEED